MNIEQESATATGKQAGNDSDQPERKEASWRDSPAWIIIIYIARTSTTFVPLVQFSEFQMSSRSAQISSDQTYYIYDFTIHSKIPTEKII